VGDLLPMQFGQSKSHLVHAHHATCFLILSQVCFFGFFLLDGNGGFLAVWEQFFLPEGDGGILAVLKQHEPLSKETSYQLVLDAGCSETRESKSHRLPFLAGVYGFLELSKDASFQLVLDAGCSETRKSKPRRLPFPAGVYGFLELPKDWSACTASSSCG
jgi:hypothetical protein